MRITFVLVEPARPANLGLACRALKTMGQASLRLVNPCPLDGEARWAAHESAEILDNATIFADLETALADMDFSIATTARRRLEHDDYPSPEDCAAAIYGKAGSVDNTALVFGRESDGLTGDELALCQAATSIPLATNQPSLNLAQAVLVYARALYQASTDAPSDTRVDPGAYARTRAEITALLEKLELDDHRRIHRWALEGVARFDDRDLGFLLTLLRELNRDQQ